MSGIKCIWQPSTCAPDALLTFDFCLLTFDLPLTFGLCVVFVLLSGCARSPESVIRKALRSGSVRLPAGIIEIHSEVALPDGARDVEILGSGSILRAADDFRGRAIFTSRSGARIRFRDFTIEGNREAIERR